MKRIALILFTFLLTFNLDASSSKVIVTVCEKLPVIEILDSSLLQQLEDIVEHKFICCCVKPRYIYVLDILEAEYNKHVIQVTLAFPRMIDNDENKGSFLFKDKRYILRKGNFDDFKITEETQELCFTKEGEEAPNGQFFEYTAPEDFCTWTLLWDKGELKVFGTMNVDPVE